MWERLLALSLAWGLAALAKWWLRGSDLEAFGIGFVLLPVFMNVVRPFNPLLMAATVMVGLGALIIATKRRSARDRAQHDEIAAKGRMSRPSRLRGRA
jgi:hypothetical protein